MTGTTDDKRWAQWPQLDGSESDRFMRFAVEHLPDPLYWIDEPGNIVYANNAASATLGYEQAELRRMKMYEINFDLDADSWPAIWGLLKAAGSRTFEARHRRRDGEILEVEVTANFLSFEQREYSCALVRSIGARKALDRRLRHAEKMEAVGRLAGGVAHDFNNQLAAILGYAEVIRRRARTVPEVLELLDPLKGVVEVAADLTSRLLAFSRPGEAELRPMDLHEVLQFVLAILSRSIDKRIQVTKALEAKQPWSLGDTSQLQSAFLNLLLNARDAMPRGGTIHVATSNVSFRGEASSDQPSDLKQGDYVLVTIRDTGTGISPNALEQVFEPFYTTKEGGAGGGLGLAIVYGTLKRHHGAVTVRSEVGKGSTFSLYLPASRAPRVISESREEPPSLRLHGHVLLIDDEASVRDAVGLMMKNLGCSVATFGDRDEALEYFVGAHTTVDLIILDLIMPGLPTQETLLAFLEADPQVPVMLMSGYSEYGQAQALLDLGARSLIHKPFSMATLARQVSALLPPK